MSACLIVFVKNLIPGKVKTRLAAEIGEEAALDLYRRLLSHTQSVIASLDYPVYVYYSDYLPEKPLWPNTISCLQQGLDIGQRMTHALGEALSQYDHAILIGSDSPDIETACISEALACLQYADVVLGPSEDGGYYLIGMRTHSQALFIGIPWSTSQVLAVTRQRLLDSGNSFALTSTRMDIDTRTDAIRAGWIITG